MSRGRSNWAKHMIDQKDPNAYWSCQYCDALLKQEGTPLQVRIEKHYQTQKCTQRRILQKQVLQITTPADTSLVLGTKRTRPIETASIDVKKTPKKSIKSLTGKRVRMHCKEGWFSGTLFSAGAVSGDTKDINVYFSFDKDRGKNATLTALTRNMVNQLIRNRQLLEIPNITKTQTRRRKKTTCC